MAAASKSFEDYAWFSVQVDQYYAAVRIFARHYEALRQSYRSLPTREDWPDDLTALPGTAATFFMVAASSLNYMGTTRIFAEARFPQLANLPTAMVNFGFYTCFCFQWTLFESFVKNSVLGLANDASLPKAVCARVRLLERRSEQFLRYIDDGHVFGHSPFTTAMPVAGWAPSFETCNYADLDAIRKQRNALIHDVKGPSILPSSELEKDRQYERSMWILRKFAENVDSDVQRVRSSSHSTSPGA